MMLTWIQNIEKIFYHEQDISGYLQKRVSDEKVSIMARHVYHPMSVSQ